MNDLLPQIERREKSRAMSSFVFFFGRNKTNNKINEEKSENKTK